MKKINPQADCNQDGHSLNTQWPRAGFKSVETNQSETEENSKLSHKSSETSLSYQHFSAEMQLCSTIKKPASELPSRCT